jgi:urease accessory protein
MSEAQMLEAHEVIRDQSQPASLTIELSFDDRQKSRHRGVTTCGKEVGWFIERGHVLKNGDFLKCSSGELIKVLLANESVSTLYAKNAQDLTRAAYHLGNRHVPLEITADYLRYQYDHVLDEMVKGLGLRVESETAPFQPEPGAYAAGHQGRLSPVQSQSHGHSHGHSHHHHTQSNHDH